MAGIREARLDAAVSQGLLPSSFRTDDPTAGKYYTGAADYATNAKSVNSGNQVTTLGNLSNTLNTITGISNANSALSNTYAQEQREWSAMQAAIANNFNSKEAQKNRDWQEMMSNTAHQREVKDLIAAGLNPVLSASGGQGASVTSGATANAVMPSGSTGQVDNSANGTLASLLGAFLSAQTQLQMMDTSARVNESVADKYTAMSKITSEIAAAASMANAHTSAEASKYSAGMNYASSQLAAQASMYASDLAYKMKQDFPDDWVNIINSMFAGRGGTGKVLNDFSDLVRRGTKAGVSGAKSLWSQFTEGMSDALKKYR